MAIIRIAKVLEETGLGRTKFYAYVREGLMVEPVNVGGRASGVPSEELLAINRARIAGATDAQVRDLVKRLHEARHRTVERQQHHHNGQVFTEVGPPPAIAPPTVLVRNMTLRDYFAARAIRVSYEYWMRDFYHPDSVTFKEASDGQPMSREGFASSRELIVKYAYDLADEMLKARATGAES